MFGRRYFLHIFLLLILFFLFICLYIVLKYPNTHVETDDFRERYWKETLLYRSHPNFCSQPVSSQVLISKLNSELARSVDSNSIKCDFQSHELHKLAGVSLNNVYSIEYDMDFDCLQRGLTLKKLFDCSPEVTPCRVPNITHVAWYGMARRRFRFHHYISLRSALTELRPHYLLFWYDALPEGEWFSEALRFARDHAPSTRLLLVHRRGPEHIYERRVSAPEHQSDVVRLEAVLQFGGIYLDLDVVVLRSFAPLRRYEMVLGSEDEENSTDAQLPDSNSPVDTQSLPDAPVAPETRTGHIGALCNGIMIAAPRAHFLRLWHLEYSRFDAREWSWHSVHLPAVLSSVRLLFPIILLSRILFARHLPYSSLFARRCVRASCTWSCARCSVRVGARRSSSTDSAAARTSRATTRCTSGTGGTTRTTRRNRSERSTRRSAASSGACTSAARRSTRSSSTSRTPTPMSTPTRRRFDPLLDVRIHYLSATQANT